MSTTQLTSIYNQVKFKSEQHLLTKQLYKEGLYSDEEYTTILGALLKEMEFIRMYSLNFNGLN